MPDINDYYVFKSTGGSGGSSGGGGGGNGFGCGWIVIAVVAILLISFIAGGASQDAIDTLLGIGIFGVPALPMDIHIRIF